MATLTAGFSAGLRRSARRRGRQAFQAFVRRASDGRLERTVGSDVGLRLLFAAMARAYEPDEGQGFAGEIQYELTRAGARMVPWTVHVEGDRATARPGRAAAPALTLTIGIPDFLRMAAGELDAGRALLTGRLDLAGDFALAQRLAQMFGRPAAL
jgi:putative sterol carrier protein